MPRIGTALGVLVVVAACIGLNTYRYPAVRQMVAGTPQLKLSSDGSTPGLSLEVPASTGHQQGAASRRAPAAGSLSAGPAGKSAEKPAGYSTGWGNAPNGYGGYPAQPEEPCADTPWSVGSSAEGATDPPAATDPPHTPSPAEDPSAPAWQTVTDAPGAENPEYDNTAVAEPSSRYAAPAAQPVRIGEVRPRQPDAPLSATDDERVAIPQESGSPAAYNPASAKPGELGNGLQRLPPVDRVWRNPGADAAQPAPADGPSVIYPSTRM